MLDIAQTFAAVAAPLASIYAIAASERRRRLDGERAPVMRVHDAADVVAEAALRVGQSCTRSLVSTLEAALYRLRAELQIVGVDGFKSTDLMTRPNLAPQQIVDQHAAAVIELRERLWELDERDTWPILGRRRARH